MQHSLANVACSQHSTVVCLWPDPDAAKPCLGGLTPMQHSRFDTLVKLFPCDPLHAGAAPLRVSSFPYLIHFLICGRTPVQYCRAYIVA